MKFEPEKIRNFVVAGHSGCGKTSLCDLMLYKAKAVDRLGSVDANASVSDFTPDEQEKHSSIYTAYMSCEWNGFRFFFSDTPGYGPFIGEVIPAYRASGAALVVLDGANGLEIGAARAFKLGKSFDIPKLAFINRLDRDDADFFRIVGQLQEAYGKNVCVPMTLPVGKGAKFERVVSVLGDPAQIPDALKEYAARCKETLFDTVAEADEALMERYLAGEQLSEAEILAGLHDALKAGTLIPVFAGSVAKDIGVSEVMSGIINISQTPLERTRVASDGSIVKPAADGPAAAFVFKSVLDPHVGQFAFFRVLTGKVRSNSDILNLNNGTKEHLGQLIFQNGKTQIPIDEACPGCICGVAKLKATKTGDTLGETTACSIMPPMTFPNPVFSCAIGAVRSGDEDKIMSGLQKLCECDPTLHVGVNQETHETIFSGMGEQHVQIALRRLRELAKVEVAVAAPKIPYREAINGCGEGHYRHKKQSGGHGQFAEVYLRIAPSEERFEFENAVVGGTIPKNFIPAVEKGVQEAMACGPLAGCVVENVKVTVYDGKFNAVDSSEMAFKIAASKAFREAMGKANPVLREPVMSVRIYTPAEFMGDITGDLNQKRGRIIGMDAEDGVQVLDAEIPLAELAKYATELRSMSLGRGKYDIEFDRYEVVPPNIANEIIAKFKAAHAEEEE